MVSKIQKKDCVYIAICVVLISLGIFTNVKYGFSLFKALSNAFLMLGCLMVARIDFNSHIIPNKILAALLITRTFLLTCDVVGGIECVQGVWRFANCLRSLTGMIIGLIVMLFVYVISRHAIGMGDVKLSAIIGFFMGTAGWYTALILGSILAAGFSIVQLIRKKMKLKDEIPLGPFLAAGVVIAVIIGA